MNLDDGRVYADFVKNIIHSNNIEIKSDGKAVRAYCYILDATIAFIKILLEGKTGNAYNVGNDECIVSVFELANILIHLYPEKNLEVLRVIEQNSNYIASTISRTIPNIDKLKNLNWFPEVTIEHGFRRTIEHYQLNKN
jgi:dTDP-D-glucose 4,6-dehydratase